MDVPAHVVEGGDEHAVTWRPPHRRDLFEVIVLESVRQLGKHLSVCYFLIKLATLLCLI